MARSGFTVVDSFIGEQAADTDWLTASNGADATADGTFSTGEVDTIDVTDPGTGYKSPPTVVITGTGTGAVGTAVLTQGVDAIEVINGGSGYTVLPTATIDPPSTIGGIQATATLVVVDNRVAGFSITEPGTGYTSVPNVTISDPASAGKTATAVSTLSGRVESITIVTGGKDWSANPSIDIRGGGFSLPVNYPDNLMTFLHLDFNLSDDTLVSIILNGVSYPINNSANLQGAAFRSIPIAKGDVFQIQCDAVQSVLQFTLGLET